MAVMHWWASMVRERGSGETAYQLQAYHLQAPPREERVVYAPRWARSGGGCAAVEAESQYTGNARAADTAAADTAEAFLHRHGCPSEPSNLGVHSQCVK